MTNEEIRDLTKDGLTKECFKIIDNYMAIYDEYYNIGSRDSAFLKDLVDSIKGISACLEVYVAQGELYPDYALEKLRYSKGIIDGCINYYERRREEY